jgi:hypothetical protein
MNTFLAYLFYYLGDFSWKMICWTDWNEITRKLISGPCWSLYQKFMTLSLNYDEKAGYIVWKSTEEQ